MEKICGIYKITSPTKKVYIGQSIDIKSRFRYYKRIACKKQTRLYNSLTKYGVSKHTFEIIHECKNGELDELEKYYISIYSCFNTEYGLNLRAGGSAGLHSEATKKKLSDSAKGRKASDKTREIMRIAAKSRPPMTDETKLKHSISAMGKNKGKKHTIETIKKMSIANSGRIHSDETKEKIRIGNLGNKNNLGKKHSEETLIKMRISFSKRIVQPRRKLVHPSVRSYYNRGCRCEECQEMKDAFVLSRRKEKISN